MLAIRLTPDIEARLNRLTQETGRTKTALAREAILGAAISTSGRSGYQDVNVARRTAEAAAVVASLQNPASALHGMQVDESASGNLDAWRSAVHEDPEDPEVARREPPPSTWFDDLDSEPMPLGQTSRL